MPNRNTERPQQRLSFANNRGKDPVLFEEHSVDSTEVEQNTLVEKSDLKGIVIMQLQFLRLFFVVALERLTMAISTKISLSFEIHFVFWTPELNRSKTLNIVHGKIINVHTIRLVH